MNERDIDIVDRLRIVWTSCHARVNDERAEAASEIERLRAGGCARDQRSTQFCREAVEADAALADCRAALKRIERERDDARRRYCHDVWQGVGDEDEQRQLTPREIAARMGWKYPEA